MIDLVATRAALEAIAKGVVPSTVTVYADGAIDGTPALPAVVVGNPSWEPGGGPSICRDKWSWPVAVLVARDGTSDPAANRELEALWPPLAAALDRETRHIPGISGRVDNARFGPFIVGGISFPAYLVTITLNG